MRITSVLIVFIGGVFICCDASKTQENKEMSTVEVAQNTTSQPAPQSLKISRGDSDLVVNDYLKEALLLSFVFERTLHYNLPIYFDDDATMIDEDAIDEQRSYFVKEELLHQLVSGDCGAPFSADYLKEEEKRIKASFAHLLKLR